MDQFTARGGTQMAVALGAVSADHLDVSGPDEIVALVASKTIAVPLPAANVNLGYTTFAPGRALVDAGAALAPATDLNPGSAPCYSMPLVMAIANRYLRLLPGETLTAATVNAAHALGLGDRVGSIAPGKRHGGITHPPKIRRSRFRAISAPSSRRSSPPCCPTSPSYAARRV